MRIYSELAEWFALLTRPDEYEEEAAFLVGALESVGAPTGGSLLELGSGAGNSAVHLKRHFACTLSDLSDEMLDLSRRRNPECEHVRGDMRTLRLGRMFDVVYVQDAIEYMTSEAELAAALGTVAAHLRPGGMAVVVPDAVVETLEPGTSAGGNDDERGRGIRYLEWTHAPEPGRTAFDVDYVFVAREGDGELKIVHERHTLGVFPLATWHALMAQAGLEVLETPPGDPYEGEHVVMLARRR